MLEQMRDPIELGRLVAGAGGRIKSDRNRLDASHRTARNPKAIGKSGEMHHR